MGTKRKAQGNEATGEMQSTKSEGVKRLRDVSMKPEGAKRLRMQTQSATPEGMKRLTDVSAKPE